VDIRKIAGATGAACLMLSGCGIGDAGAVPTHGPVRYGKAAPSGHVPINASGRQVVPAGEWPDACGLLSDKEIRALLPQAGGIRRQYQQSIADEPFISARPGAPDSTFTAPHGGCVFSFAIPRGAGTLAVAIHGVGGPGLVRRAYAERLKSAREDDHPRRVSAQAGPQTCFRESPQTSNVECRQGPILFGTSGSGVAAGAGTSADLDAWTTHAVIPAAATIAAKIA